MKTPIPCIVILSMLPALQKAGAYEKEPTFAPSDPHYGDYVGTARTGDTDFAARAMVIPEKHKDRPFHYRVRIVATEGERKIITELSGEPGSKGVKLAGDRDGKWTGLIEDGVLSATRTGDKPAKFRGTFTKRKSSTEGLRPPEGATVLLPYRPGERTNLDQWKNKNWRLLDDGSVEVAKGGNVSLCEFGAVKMHVEFALPYKCYDFGQGRGNSGVYLQGCYEVQVLDTYGFDTNPGHCGGIYGNAPASVEHVCFPPTSWQTYDITFHPAGFGDGGKRTQPARITVVHNGTTIHDDLEIKNAPTAAAIVSSEAPRGPLHLQDHGNPVRFRNIWFVPIGETGPQNSTPDSSK